MAFELIVHTPGDVYVSGLCKAFQSSGDIYAVPVDITIVDDYIAGVYSDTEPYPAIGIGFSFTTGQFTLYFESTTYCVGSTVKLNQKSVAHGPDQSTVMLRDLGLDQIFDMICKLNVRSFLINAHQSAVADNVCEQNSLQPALQV
jgi:hypothetical protein